MTARSLLGGDANDLRGSITAYTPDQATPLTVSTQVVRPNYSTEGFSTTNWVHARTEQLADTLTMARGRHEVKVGGEIVRLDARVCDLGLKMEDSDFAPLVARLQGELDAAGISLRPRFYLSTEYGCITGSATIFCTCRNSARTA